MTPLITRLVELLLLMGIAVVVRMVSTRLRVPYSVILVLMGFAVSVSSFRVGISLSPELILSVLLPTILFQGAEATKSSQFRDTLPVALVMTIVGLPLAVLLLGLVGSYVFAFPLIITLLFAAIVYPVDPVSVIAIFRETDAPERIGVLAETESHLSEGFAIVTFSALLGLVTAQQRTGESIEGLVTLEKLGSVAVDVTAVSVGGVLVGLATGGAAYLLLRRLRERMTQLLVVIVLPYGSYLLAEKVFHLSGVLAVVAAGLVLGTYGKERAMDSEQVEFVESIWQTAGFIASTLLFLLVGIRVPLNALFANAELILVAALLVVLTRAAAVYVIVAVTNQAASQAVPLDHQHVLVWGGMHTVIPVALFLSLPESVPFHGQLGAMVFGVAVLSILLQGLLMPYVLRTTGMTGSAKEISDV